MSSPAQSLTLRNSPPCLDCGGTGLAWCQWCSGAYHKRGSDEICDRCHLGRVRCEPCDGTGVNLWLIGDASNT